MGSLTRDDLLEFANTPEYQGGDIKTFGLSINHFLTKRIGIFAKHITADSKNSGLTDAGKMIPYIPQYTNAAGLTWIHPMGWYFTGRLVYRSDRYTDEANTILRQADWDSAFDLYWQSKRKDWLFRFSVDDALKKNQDTQYTAEINFRF